MVSQTLFSIQSLSRGRQRVRKRGSSKAVSRRRKARWMGRQLGHPPVLALTFKNRCSSPKEAHGQSSRPFLRVEDFEYMSDWAGSSMFHTRFSLRVSNEPQSCIKNAFRVISIPSEGIRI